MDRRSVIKNGLAVGALGLMGFGSRSESGEGMAGEESKGEFIEKENMKFWLETSLRRVYPNSPAEGRSRLFLMSAKNEHISFQACFRNTGINSAVVDCEVVGAEGFKVKVRRVGFVPMKQLNTATPKLDCEGIGFIPGMCPDPIYPESSVHIGPSSNAVFWVNVHVPEKAKTGVHKLTVKLTLKNQYAYVAYTDITPITVELPVEIDVRSLVLKRRKDFPVTQWISADSIWEWYKIAPCSDRFFEIADKFIENAISHGVDVIYTPLINNRHEILERPAQLLRVKRTATDKYEFDFTDVRKWVRIAVKHKANHIEWPHFFTPAPTSGKHPQRIYERDVNKIGPLLWPTDISSTSDTYKKFLQQFLPEFKKFLIEEKIFDISLFHCADEPDGPIQIADYRKARALLKELAPWMKVMDAMSDPHFATERLSDMPVPSIVTAPLFQAAGCPSWVYFCCGPRDGYLQRLLDTPLSKIRMSGLLFYKLDAKGFLHWGHNYWFIFCTSVMGDPFSQADVTYWPSMPYGDAFVVYPGADGPLDSVRWEVFSESLQDYALLQAAGIKQNDPLLAELKDYMDFPKTEEWVTNFRKTILERF